MRKAESRQSAVKKEVSIIGETQWKKCVGGKRLAGNRLRAKRRQFASAMARFD
jgi:hypothetical protein